MFKLIKQVFIVLLSFSGSLTTKCASLNNEQYIPTLISLNSDNHDQRLHQYPVILSLHRRNWICNTVDDLSSRLCVSSKSTDAILNGFNMITGTN